MRLQGCGAHVESMGLLDTPQRSREAGHACRRADVDVLFLYVTTYALLAAQGVSERGPILAIGNTNSRYRFPVGARRFVEPWNDQGPAHHCAVGLGHMAGGIARLARLLGIPFVQIC